MSGSTEKTRLLGPPGGRRPVDAGSDGSVLMTFAQTLSGQAAETLTLCDSPSRGVLVAKVAAAGTELRPGDRLTLINGNPVVVSAAEATALIRAQAARGPVTISVERASAAVASGPQILDLQSIIERGDLAGFMSGDRPAGPDTTAAPANGLLACCLASEILVKLLLACLAVLGVLWLVVLVAISPLLGIAFVYMHLTGHPEAHSVSTFCRLVVNVAFSPCTACFLTLVKR